MFSTTAEYALRSMVFLAMRYDSTQPGQQVAAGTKVPMDYLLKVLNSLGRAGLVQAQRGKHGGFSLMRDPAEISIFDIIQAVDPLKRIATCPLGLKGHGVRLCSLHRKLDDALRHVEEAFTSTSLADLIEERSPVSPLCDEQIITVKVKPSRDGKTAHAEPV